MIISKVKEIVKSKHNPADFKYHICVVVRNALKLAKIKKADMEVVELAAWLHDLGRVGKNIKSSNNHHLGSAKVAEIILKDLGYPKDRMNKVIQCVICHSAKGEYIPKTIEEKIIANADAMAHFDSFLNLFDHFIRKGKFEEMVEFISDKIENDWNKKLTLPEAKELVKEKYNAVRLILDSIVPDINN